jgi:hypothetical protein
MMNLPLESALEMKCGKTATKDKNAPFGSALYAGELGGKALPSQREQAKPLI